MNIFRTLASGKNSFREEFVSAFIAYLFSPKMDHGLNFLVLSRLLINISKKNKASSLKELADNLKSRLWENIFEESAPHPVVELEFAYGGGKGYIDVVIRCDNWFIIIENKISAASRTEGQIRDQYVGFRESLQAKVPQYEEARVLVVYLVPAVQGGEGWSVAEGFKKEMDDVVLRAGDEKVLVTWQPVMSTDEEPVSMVSLLREILHDDANGNISPLGSDVRHAILSLIDFSLGEFQGYHYPKAATNRNGEPKKLVSEIMGMEGSWFVGVKAGKAGAIQSAWKNPGYLSYELTVTEDSLRGWQYLPLVDFQRLVRWSQDPETETLEGIIWEGKPFFTPLMYKVAKWGKSDLWIGIKGGEAALAAMSPEDILSRNGWEVASKKKSTQWFSAEEFCSRLEAKGITFE